MRRRRMARPAAAGARLTAAGASAAACAALLAVPLAACSPVSRPAATSLATIFPSRGTAAAHPGGPARAHATGVDSGSTTGNSGSNPNSIRAARLLRSALADPDAIAAAGSGVWVANAADGSGRHGWISEFSAASGALIRVIAGPRYGLADPRALAVEGGDLWVADGNGGGLTELDAATGALIRVAAGPQYQFADPGALAVAGHDLWVANGGGNSVTEVDGSTGALVRVISAPRYRLGTTVYAPAIAVAAGRVWVPDGTGDSVTEINAATGALIRVISGPAYQLNGPDAIAAAGDDVWVIDVNSGAVTEINAVTGGLIRVIAVPNVPFAITADRAGLWLMTNLGVKAVDGSRPDGALDEFSAATGRLIMRIAGPPFRSDNPGGAITSDGDHVWATDTNFYSYRGWVAELSAGTGDVARVIGAKTGHVERS